MTGNRRKFLVVVAGACLLWPYIVTGQGYSYPDRHREG
jgi:hypothetical protein